MPRDTEVAATAGQGGADASGGTGAAAGTAVTDTRPGGGLGVPLDPEGTNDPWAKYKWWILGGLGLVMAAGAGFMLTGNQKAGVAPAGGAVAVAGGSASLLGTMKEELFALETDKLQGRLTEKEYLEQKAALEVVLRRALLRGEGGPDASNVAGPVA
jgi:hypothetical protein